MLGRVLRRLLRRGADRASGTTTAHAGGSGRAEAWLEEALQLQRAARHPELLALCESILKRMPDNTEALQLLAVALCAVGRSREGLIHLRRVTELTPDAPQAHFNFATVLAAAGEAEDAIASFREAVRLQPGFSEAWNAVSALLKAL